jgi:hypothetical protein
MPSANPGPGNSPHFDSRNNYHIYQNRISRIGLIGLIRLIGLIYFAFNTKHQI